MQETFQTPMPALGGDGGAAKLVGLSLRARLPGKWRPQALLCRHPGIANAQRDEAGEGLLRWQLGLAPLCATAIPLSSVD
jgi:hypothetical protein